MRGESGRVVVELDPDLKRRLHGALAREGVTLKRWLTGLAEQYISEQEQPRLPGIVSRKSRPRKS